jgi:hypothetical protein
LTPSWQRVEVYSTMARSEENSASLAKIKQGLTELGQRTPSCALDPRYFALTFHDELVRPMLSWLYSPQQLIPIIDPYTQAFVTAIRDVIRLIKSPSTLPLDSENILLDIQILIVAIYPHMSTSLLRAKALDPMFDLWLWASDRADVETLQLTSYIYDHEGSSNRDSPRLTPFHSAMEITSLLPILAPKFLNVALSSAASGNDHALRTFFSIIVLIQNGPLYERCLSSRYLIQIGMAFHLAASGLHSNQIPNEEKMRRLRAVADSLLVLLSLDGYRRLPYLGSTFSSDLWKVVIYARNGEVRKDVILLWTEVFREVTKLTVYYSILKWLGSDMARRVDRSISHKGQLGSNLDAAWFVFCQVFSKRRAILLEFRHEDRELCEYRQVCSYFDSCSQCSLGELVSKRRETSTSRHAKM